MGGVAATGSATSGSGGTTKGGSGAASGGGSIAAGGGGAVSGAGGTESDSGIVTDGSVGSGDAIAAANGCPLAPPSSTTSCTSGLACTYGTDPRPSCRARYDCASGAWLATAVRCTQIPACTSESPPAVVGTACSTLGHFCQYSDNLTCGCVPCPDGSCPGPYVWNCAPAPAAPCPAVPPNLGEACDASAQKTCKYAFCPIAPYVVAACRNGAWTWDTSCNGP